jgi:hypothetical protein
MIACKGKARTNAGVKPLYENEEQEKENKNRQLIKKNTVSQFYRKKTAIPCSRYNFVAQSPKFL